MKQIKNKMIMALIMSLPMQGLLQAESLKIRQIETKNIEYNAKRVGQLLFKHRAAKIGFFVANLVGLYRFLQPFYNKFSPNSPPELRANQELVNHESVQEIKKTHLLGRMINLISSKKLWYELLLGSSTIITQSLVIFIAQKLMTAVDHPHTMTWFLYEKVPYKKTFEQVDEYAQLLAHDSIDKERSIYYKQRVNNLCNQLIKQMEQIAGFMLYKGTQLKNGEQGKIKEIICHLSHCTNDWAIAINTLFNQELFDSQQFIKLVTDYEKELKRELNNFSCVEGETSSDLLHVIRMHTNKDECE